MAEDRDRPGIGSQLSREHSDRGRLSGTVRTEQPYDLAGCHLKREVVNGPHLPERITEPRHGERTVGHLNPFP